MVYYLSEMTATDPKKCSVEGCDEPRADQSDSATNRHCRKHRAEAQRNWTLSKSEQDAAKHFHRGVSALREHLAVNFERYTIQRFSGPEIADIVRRAVLPSS